MFLLPASNHFKLDPVTGKLFINTLLDAEAAMLHTVVLIATDGGGLSDTRTLSINVIDVDDNPHTFMLQMTSCVLQESANVGDVVGTLSPLSELDVIDNSVAYKYDIVDGNAAAKFKVSKQRLEMLHCSQIL